MFIKSDALLCVMCFFLPISSHYCTTVHASKVVPTRPTRPGRPDRPGRPGRHCRPHQVSHYESVLHVHCLSCYTRKSTVCLAITSALMPLRYCINVVCHATVSQVTGRHLKIKLNVPRS